jgi:hypothetical protein
MIKNAVPEARFIQRKGIYPADKSCLIFFLIFLDRNMVSDYLVLLSGFEETCHVEEFIKPYGKDNN